MRQGCYNAGMASRKYEVKMKLVMPADEALERFIATDPKEMHANIDKAKKKKPPGSKKAKPSDGDSVGDNVASLAQRRVRKRNTGR